MSESNDNLTFYRATDWIDQEDLDSLKFPQQIELLRDITVTRTQGEFAGLKRGFIATARPLTHKQRVALDLQEDAIHAGKTPSKVIANHFQTSVQVANRLLRRAEGKMVLLTENSVSINVSPTISAWFPTEADIQNRMIHTPRRCASGQSEHCKKRSLYIFYVCSECNKLHPLHLLDTDDFFSTARWLQPEIRRLRSEHRRKCIEDLYLEHFGSISFDEIAELITQGETSRQSS